MVYGFLVIAITYESGTEYRLKGTMGTNAAVVGYYDLRWIALSIFVSILVAYAALDLAECVAARRGRSGLAWLYGGGCAMGIGIWTMHYVGMAAFHLALAMPYGLPIVLLSFMVALLASGMALYAMSRSTIGLTRTVSGSLILGAGIAGMHSIAMDATRLQAKCVYSPAVVASSVLLAFLISLVALQLVFAGRKDTGPWDRGKLESGLFMGAALPTVHHHSMAAVHFIREPYLNGGLTHAFAFGPFGLAIIVAGAIVILAQVYAYSVIRRRSLYQAGQLAERGLQLKAIFDNLMEGIMVLDKRNNVVQINPAATRILGLPEKIQSVQAMRELLEVRTLDGKVLPPDEWPGASGLRGAYVRGSELEIRSRYSGKSTIAEISTAPIANAAGEPVQVIIAYRDITERKRTEETRARLAAIVRSSQDAIIGKDPNGIITSWNKGAEKIFGYAAEEMIGTSIQRLLPPGQEHEEDDILERLRRGETIEQLEKMQRRKDGTLILCSQVISPIRDGSNRIVGASKIARDITERKLLERQLRQSQKMEAIGQLTGGIAHDFNNLLAVVIGNLGLLERMVAGNEAALKRLMPAQKAAARGAELTRRMLALASKEDLYPSTKQVEEAVRETIELAGRLLGPEIRIVTDFDTSVPAVYVDAAGLESALLNLAVNARDAMPRGGTLTFSTQLCNLDEYFPAVQSGELKTGPYARLAVSDTGHGMSRETLERALEPFFTTKPRDKGTGLGLAMVYGFARQSGGTVRLYSEEGYGTTVSLYLPLAGEPAPASPEVAPPSVPAHPGATVLLVDDEMDLLEVAHTFLTELGYTAVRADSAASALNAIALDRDISLMITDIIMPGGMNGVELAQKARRLNPNLKVVFSSGFPADALTEREGSSMDGPLLRKPYQRTEFAAIIHRTLARPQPSRDNKPAAEF